MTYNPTQLSHLEILSLLAGGLIPFLKQVRAGETDPFPYPDELLRGFNQLLIACAVQEVEHCFYSFNCLSGGNWLRKISLLSNPLVPIQSLKLTSFFYDCLDSE